MLVRLTPRQRFDILVSQFEPIVRKAFLDAIDDITSNIVIARVVERLERGDVAGAINAMHLDEAAFRSLDEALRQAFSGGGVAAVEQMPVLRDPEGHQIIVRFDTRNLAAETWLRQESSNLITNIVADQRAGIRTALEEGLSRGDNPTRTALSVAGRVNRATGRREGGIVGLTSQQGAFVANARQELSSGDPEAMQNYLRRGRRDRRFDRTVRAAIKAEKPLPQDIVAKITGRYADGLLKLRADTIGLHETMAALSASKDIAFRQQIEKGSIAAGVVTKTWKHTPQEHPRVQHVAMQGQTVQFDQPFTAPDGTPIPYPHAPGVPARHTLGCKCLADYKIDFTAQYLARRS